MNRLTRGLKPWLPLVIELTALCSSIPAQTGDEVPHCTALIEQAKQAAKIGSFDHAEELLRSAASLLPQSGTREAVELWNEMGDVHESQAKLSEAERDFRRALQLNSELQRPNLVDMAVSLNDLGSISETRRQYGKAEAFFHRSLAALKDGGMLSSPAAASVITNLAASIERQGRYKEAARLFDEGLPRLKESYSETSTEYIKAAGNLALLDFETGKYLAALEIQRKICRIQGLLPYVSNHDKALALNNLGLLLLELGDVGEAESHFRKAITLERGSSVVNSGLVEDLNNLAVLEQRVGRLAEAERDQTEALKIALREFPDTDPMIANIWNNLGKVAASRRRFKEAKQLYQRAEAAWLKCGGRDGGYSATLSNMAALEAQQGRRKQANQLYEKVLEMDQTTLGPYHPRVAADLSNLAAQLYQQKRLEASIQLFRRTKEIQEMVFGPENVQVARTLRNMAVVYRASKRFAEADEAYRRAIQARDVSGKDSPELISWLHEYAEVLRNEEKFGEAEQAEVHALGIRVRNAETASKHDGS